MKQVRVRAALIVIGSVALILPGPVAAGIEPQTTTTSASAEPTSVDHGGTLTLHATVTPNGPAADGSDPFGQVEWNRATGTFPSIQRIALTDLDTGETAVQASISHLAPGTHTIWAVFDSDNPEFSGSVSEQFQVTVGPAPSTTLLVGSSPVELHGEVSMSATVSADVAEPSGSVDFYEVGNPTPICSEPTTAPGLAHCSFPAEELGTTSYYAEYTGGSAVSASTSDTIQITVVENSVQAVDFEVQYGTFYPVNDGYRDTVGISGVRLEDISGTVQIYKPSGTLIKTFTITLGSGIYTVSWNGRNGSGDVFPEGKYKIVHTLEDVHSSTTTITRFVMLSKKKLIWHSDSITKNGAAFTAFGKDGDGSVATSSGVVRLRTPDGFGGDWAGVGYQFLLKDAFAYKAVKVSVNTTRALVGGPEARVGAQDFDDCAYAAGAWSEGCFDKWESIGHSTSKTWWKTNALDARHLAGRKVRSMVSNGSGTTFVYKAKVAYKWATLGY